MDRDDAFRIQRYYNILSKLSIKTVRYAKKQENMTHTKERKNQEAIKTVFEGSRHWI
jgi:hypothetical protein